MKLNEAIVLYHLNESRRNPHINPRVPMSTALSLYAGRDDVFVHFSNVEKIGINPQTTHDTPYGIYSYPIDHVRERTMNFMHSIDGRMEYASNFRYMFIIQSNAQNVLHVQNYHRYDRDIAMIEDFFSSQFPDKTEFVMQIFERTREQSPSKVKALWEGMYYAIEELGLNEASTSYTILHKVLGYEMIRDDGDGIVHPNEPYQAIHFGRSYFKVLEMIDKRNEEEDEEEELKKMFGGRKKTVTKIHFEGEMLYIDRYGENRVYSYDVFGQVSGVILYSVDMDVTYYVTPDTGGGVFIAKDAPNGPSRKLSDREFLSLFAQLGFNINDAMNHLLSHRDGAVRRIVDSLGRGRGMR